MKKRKEIVLNDDQKEAVRLINEFLKSDKRFFVLSGRAGTGKSTVMYDVFKRKRPNKDEFYVPSNICGVTITHQARINLMQHIPTCTTYASAANLLMEIDPNGNIYFVENGHSYRLSELKRFKTIVPDECSMFDQKMEDILVKCVDDKAKIIYVGDHHQLPPIGIMNDDDSPTFKHPDRYELKEVMRQTGDNDILKLADRICDAIDGDHSLEFINTLENHWNPTTKKGYAITSFQNAINSFVNNFKKGDNVRITSYRNTRIRQINDIVRSFLWEDYNSMFVVGEFIVMNDQYSPDGFVLAYNGETFKVVSIGNETIESVPCYVLKVNKGTNKNPDFIYLPVPTERGTSVYRRRLSELKDISKKLKDWGEYMRYKRLFASVSYGYCVSNYKIQGATTKGCYVDLSDIMDVKMLSNKRKLQAFYTGVSRPTDYLAIF